MLKERLRLAKGMYFALHDRLYYVIDQEIGTENLLIEDCSTLEQNWTKFGRSDQCASFKVITPKRLDKLEFVGNSQREYVEGAS